MKKVKKLVAGLGSIAIILSIATPAFAASPIKGWISEGTYTGYPYISWTQSGKLWAGVAAQDKNTNALRDYTTKSGTNNLYVRTPSSKLYSEKIYRGYYANGYN